MSQGVLGHVVPMYEKMVQVLLCRHFEVQRDPNQPRQVAFRSELSVVNCSFAVSPSVEWCEGRLVGADWGVALNFEDVDTTHFGPFSHTFGTTWPRATPCDMPSDQFAEVINRQVGLESDYANYYADAVSHIRYSCKKYGQPAQQSTRCLHRTCRHPAARDSSGSVRAE